MIEINTDHLTKFRTKGAKDKKKRKSDRDKVTIQGKTLEERKKEAEERAKKDKVAEYIWERRMEGKKDDGGAKRE